MSRRLFKLGLVLTLALAGSALIGIMPAFAGTADTIVVHPGQSIQRAVNHAQPGDTIVVEAGVYHQSVLIKHTNDLTLKGAGAGAHGTVLMPPVGTSARTNACERFQSGICILGTGGNIVDGTRVTGFRVTGFAGFGIVALGTSNSMFDHNAAINDGEYGMTSFNSTGNSYEHNLAVGSDEAGFYYGDSPNANGTFENNVSRGNLFGFFLRDAAHGKLQDNVATGNCDGFMFLDTGSGIGGLWTAEHNVASRNNKFCPANEEGPAISGVGMAILGDDGVVLRENQVIGNVPSGDAQISGGIVVLSSEPLGGNVENGNKIVENTAFHNKPKDVIWDGNGTGNTFTDNNCGKSAPASICN
jgi:parallel beta-helix repeat protein